MPKNCAVTVTPTVSSEGKKLSLAKYEFVSIDVTKTVNKIPYAKLVIIDGSEAKQQFEVSDQDVFAPGKKVEIKLRHEGDKEVKVFAGIVVKHRVRSTPRGGASLVIELKDSAVKYTLARKNTIFEKKTDLKIIQQVLAASKGKSANNLGLAHEQMVQYHSTDWDFALSRADANANWLIVDDGKITIDAPKLSTATAKFKYGIDVIDGFELEVDINDQLAAAQGSTWEIKNQQLVDIKPVDKSPFVLKQKGLSVKDYAKALGNAKDALIYIANVEKKEVEAWAQAKMQKTQLSLLKGYLKVSGRADIKVGDTIAIEGVGQRFDGNLLVTGIRHQVHNQIWKTNLQFGLTADWFIEQNNVNSQPAAGLMPGMHGLQIGVVKAFKKDDKNFFRVQVQLPALGKDSKPIWARLSSIYASKKTGVFFRPEVKDEVIVGFLNDDPRQAIILGSMHNPVNKPPFEIEKENKTKGVVVEPEKQAMRFFFDQKEATINLETSPKTQAFFKDEEAIQLTLEKTSAKLEKASGLTVDTDQKVTMKCKSDLAVETKAGATLKSGAAFKLEGKGKVTVKGSQVDVQ